MRAAAIGSVCVICSTVPRVTATIGMSFPAVKVWGRVVRFSDAQGEGGSRVGIDPID